MIPMYAPWSCKQLKGSDKDVGFSMWPSMVLVIEQVLCNMIVGKKEGGDQVASNLVMHVMYQTCFKPILSQPWIAIQPWRAKSEYGNLVKVILNSLCYEISANKTFKVFGSSECRRLSIHALFSFLMLGDAFQTEWRQLRRRRRRSLFELTKTSHAPYKCLGTCTSFLERCGKWTRVHEFSITW